MKTQHKAACSTATKRKGLAEAIVAIAKDCGATCEIKQGALAPRALNVSATIGPRSVHMCFDGDSNVGAFLAHWCTHGAATFPRDFGCTIGGTVNKFHFGKATTCVDTPEQLIAHVRAGLDVCRQLHETEMTQKHGLPADAFERGRAAYAKRAINAFRA